MEAQFRTASEEKAAAIAAEQEHCKHLYNSSAIIHERLYTISATIHRRL